jgi:RimJ/RimL family protein N-acetyltransferase
MIVYGEGLRSWLESKLGDKMCKDAQFIGRLKTEYGDPVAVIGFHSYTGEDIELAVAADPGGGTPGLLQCMYNYIFRDSGCNRCTVQIREDNLKSIKLAKRLGFKYEGAKRKAKEGKDMLIFGLLKTEVKHDR